MDLMDGNAVSVNVGGHIRQLRQAKGLSIRALARQSGISANALSMIERGNTSPSVSTLYKLTEALGISIAQLFLRDVERKEVVFRKASERIRIPFMRGLWEGLGGESFSSRVEPFALTLESGASSGPGTMSHSGHEFVLCLRGQLDYQVENEVFLLEPGDSLLFSSHLKHRWRNPGPTVTDVIFVLSGFEEDDLPGMHHVPSTEPEAEE